MQKITPFLWFDHQAEEAAQYYVSIFKNSRIISTTRYEAASAQASGQPVGSVMTVAFELAGQPFTAINGGPVFKFNESISFVINCQDQAEIDYYWEKLTAGGDQSAQQCGWLKDKYGVSWQVVPEQLAELMANPDSAKVGRMMQALMKMKKLDIKILENA